MAISLILYNNLSRTHILTTVNLLSHEVISLYLVGSLLIFLNKALQNFIPCIVHLLEIFLSSLYF